MKELEKTYIECRAFILGEKNVGKKSFIFRILHLSSTSEIRNLENEENYNNKLLKLINKIEEEEKFFKESEEQKKEKSKKSGNESSSSGNISILKNIKKDETKTITKMSDTSKYFSSNLNYEFKNFQNKIENSKIYHRPPVPEYPSKLFNIYKTKIIFKPYFISPAEDIPYDSIPKDDEDSDYEFEKENKITMKGIKNDIDKIMNIKKTIIEYEKINGYKMNVYYIFIFLYDMSDFLSYESIIKYYTYLKKKYNSLGEENFIFCVVGNKNDKKIILNNEQNKIMNDFIFKNNLKQYEISTKPFFNFSKFFVELIKDNIGPLYEDLFKEKNFQKELSNIIESKSNFSKAIRTSFDPYIDNPGPEYDLNIYGFNSIKELKEALINKRTRFTRKIFINKKGPLIFKSKSTKDLLSVENNKDKNLLYISQGGILNKPIVGFTFGTTKGKLNLIKSRKELCLERNKSLIESIEGDCTLNNKNLSVKSRGEEYFKEVEKRKEKIKKERRIERNLKLDKIAKIHQNNLDRITSEKELDNKIYRMNKSSSGPLLFENELNENKKKQEINFNKQRYYDILYNKNKDYLDKFKSRRIKIEKDRKRGDKERDNEIDKEKARQIEEEKEKEKEKEKLRERKLKFRRSIDSDSLIRKNITIKEGPSYPDLKDEFELIVEKNMKRNNINREFKPRFQEIIKEKEQRPYNDQEIWKRWELNKENIKEKGHLKIFLDYCKQKENEHNENMKKIEEQNEEIKKIRKEILIKKGYNDPSELKTINYSLVEESSPKYSIKGRNYKNEEIRNVLLGQNMEMIEYIRNSQLNRPLPNINYVKPNLPNVIFSRAERFTNYNKPYEGSLDLFKDGIFAPKTQEDFLSKGTFSQKEKNGAISIKKDNSPSPCDYKIKSCFEIIAEEGKKISDIRRKIKINQEIEKQNRSLMEIENKKEEIKEKNENFNKINDESEEPKYQDEDIS